jgi:DNA gyrase subunit A
VGLALVKEEDDLVLMTDKGQTIRTNISGIRETGRNAQGVKVMNVAEDERVVAIETIAEREEDENSADVDDEQLDSPAADEVTVEPTATNDAVDEDAE